VGHTHFNICYVLLCCICCSFSDWSTPSLVRAASGAASHFSPGFYTAKSKLWVSPPPVSDSVRPFNDSSIVASACVRAPTDSTPCPSSQGPGPPRRQMPVYQTSNVWKSNFSVLLNNVSVKCPSKPSQTTGGDDEATTNEDQKQPLPSQPACLHKRRRTRTDDEDGRTTTTMDDPWGHSSHPSTRPTHPNPHARPDWWGLRLALAAR
jgi:hypothetical protein